MLLSSLKAFGDDTSHLSGPNWRPNISSRTTTDVRELVRETLREEAAQRGSVGYPRVVLGLCDLHATVRLDKRFDQSRILQGAAAVARRRLIDVHRRLARELRRKGVPRPENIEARISAALAHAAATERPQRPPADAPGHDAGHDPGSTNDDQYYGDATNQPGQYSGGHDPGGHAPTGVPDHGWELVELIQRTIVPDYWETRGGPGVIRYDAMRMALVVRANTTTHERIGGFLRP